MNGNHELFSQKTPFEMFDRALNTPMTFITELKHLIDIALRYYNARKKRSFP